MSKKVIVEYDGASKGNPGRSGAGAVLKDTDGNVVARVREGLGRDTNNGAEYKALNRGLETAIEMGYDSVHVKGDSELVYNQVKGRWRTKNENMAKYCKKTRELSTQFDEFEISHLPRGFNSDADSEANKAVHLPPGHVEKESGGRGYYGGYYY